MPDKLSPSETVNVASRLIAMAKAMPDAVAVAEPLGYDRQRKRQYRQMTFRELNEDSDRIAHGLREAGLARGTRLALMVRPGIDFISIVFGLFKAGMVSILIDPGMGRFNLIRCLTEVEPEGFVAIPLVHAVRSVLRGKFPKAKFNLTVGKRWFWGGPTLNDFRLSAHQGTELTNTKSNDLAAIIFTTGSTGPPKGVAYEHGVFDAQVTQLREFYDIRSGEIDVPGFPLFGLFNCAMGVTTVIPDMDPSRPARVDPKKILEAINDWKATQSFGSPAIWNRVGSYCQEKQLQLPTLRRVLSAGAPVPADVLKRMKQCIASEGDIHTPYGATESLPVSSIAASEVLDGTEEQTAQGAGVCVGCRFPGICWKIIRVVDGPIPSFDKIEELPIGEIGEIIVQGPVVTREYVNHREANALGKIPDGNTFWHRMGDVGYLDSDDRLWFCGRKAHRVQTAEGTLYSVQCEAIFNQHPKIFRSALVGIGEPGSQRPVIILEPQQDQMPRSRVYRETLLEEIRALGKANPRTVSINDMLLHPSFPVDIRHNAKIFREKLAVWASKKLRKK